MSTTKRIEDPREASLTASGIEARQIPTGTVKVRPEACARPATLSAEDFRRRMRGTIRIASR